jgi:hypothetical protein
MSATSDEEQLEAIEPLDANTAPESELIHARQRTMLWNEEHCLDIAPGQRRIPENIIYDTHAEEF